MSNHTQVKLSTARRQMRNAAHNIADGVPGSMHQQIAGVLLSIANGMEFGFDTFHPQVIARLRDLAGSLESLYHWSKV